MKEVYRALDEFEARLIVGMLGEHGIEAVVQGAELGMVRGEVPFTAVYPTVWLVNEGDEAKAGELIRTAALRVNPQTCSRCGYDLRGLKEAKCPECGQAFRIEESWKCAACGETIEGQFTECWKCGAERQPGPASGGER